MDNKLFNTWTNLFVNKLSNHRLENGNVGKQHLVWYLNELSIVLYLINI